MVGKKQDCAEHGECSRMRIEDGFMKKFICFIQISSFEVFYLHKLTLFELNAALNWVGKRG